MKSIPDIQNKVVEIKLYPGDIFYLPAGWFHQVTSTGGRHMAINHWWRPPGWRNTVEIERKMKYQLLKDLKERFQKNKEHTVQYNMDNNINNHKKENELKLSDEF